MPYRLLADAVLILHLAFVAFVVFGGFLVLRWPRLKWLHLAALAWGILIELFGLVCPLTPLEVRLRELGGEDGYDGGFIEHYIVSLLYPEGLTRQMQLWLAVLLVLVNTVIYGFVFHRRRSAPEQR